MSYFSLNRTKAISAILLVICLLLTLATPASANEIWKNTTVDSEGGTGFDTSMAFNPISGHPAISYVESSGLKYAWFDGNAWNKTTVDATGYVTVPSTSMAFNSTGHPAISYFDFINKALKYTWFNGTTWQNTTVDSTGVVGQYSSMAFNSTSGYPAISYSNETSKALKYAWFDGNIWKNITVDATGNIELHNSIAFNTTSGYPAISYYDKTNGDLKYAGFDGNTWKNTTVDSTGNVGLYSSMAFNSTSGYPAISYHDQTNFDLKYAWLVPAGDLPINSSVDGAWVYVDGVNQSVQTNLTLTLETGTYNVTVMKELYETPVNQSMTVTKGANTAVEFSLTPIHPIAGFTATPISGTVPLNVSFTDGSTNNPQMWNLSFGDGTWHNTTDADQVNTSHVYTEAGTYTATLDVTARGITNSTSTTITVSEEPSPTPSRDSGTSHNRVTATAGNVPAGDTATLQINRGALSSIEVTAGSEMSDLRMTVTRTAGIAPKNPVYEYHKVEVHSSNGGSVSSAEFHFTVSKEWIIEQQCTKGDVVMLHYTDDEWKTLSTRFEGEDEDGNYIYTAITSRFSMFAIAMEENGTIMEDGEDETPQESETEVEEIAITTEPAEQSTVEEENETPFISSLMAIAIIASAGLLFRRKEGQN